MTLHSVDEHVDVDDLRVELEDVRETLLTVAEEVAQLVVEHGRHPLAVRHAQALLGLIHQERVLRRRLAVEVAG